LPFDLHYPTNASFDNVWPSKKSRRIFMFPNLVRFIMAQDVGYDQSWAILKCSPSFQLDFQPDSHNENQLTPLHVRIKLKIDLKFSHEWEPIMRTNSNLYIQFFLENQTSSFIALKYGFWSLCISCWVLLLFLLRWVVALLLLILLFSHCFFSLHVVTILLSSHMVLLFSCDEVI
jgi:hypothetical protein